MIAGNRLGTAGSRDARVHGRRSDASMLSSSLVLVLALLVVDLTDVLDTGPSVRYLILLPPLLAVLMLWGSVPLPFTRRATSSDRVLLVLFVWGLAGTVIGKSLLGTETSGLPIFLPMALGLVHLWAVEGLADEEAARSGSSMSRSTRSRALP